MIISVANSRTSKQLKGMDITWNEFINKVQKELQKQLKNIKSFQS